MADAKITALTDLGASVATDDTIPVVDATDTTTKKTTIGDVLGIAHNADTIDGIHANATATANQLMPLDANAKVNSGLLYNPYKFRVSRNAAANTGNNAFATIAFDTEQYDTGNNFSAGVFTAPVSGYYQFNWAASISTSGAQLFVVSLFINGSRYTDGNVNNTTSVQTSSVGSDTVYVGAGQTADIRAYTTATRAIDVGSINVNHFSGFLVSTL